MTEMNSENLRSGVVSEVFPKMCNVILDNSDPTKKLLCTYRRGQMMDRNPEWRERSPVAPGDLVEVKVLGSKDGVIEVLKPRRNKIQRKAPGKDGQVLHTIATNVDQVVIVSAFLDPPFSPGLIDRFLIATQQEEIVPLIVINKMDLAANHTGDLTPWKLYSDMGYQCFPLTVKDASSLNALKEKLKGKTSVFCGHSGVGKTSLLHEIFGEKIGKIGTVNAVTGKGKHTTTVSMLLQTEDGTRFIDTPGIKEFGLFNITPKELLQHFPELYEISEKRESIEHLPRYESYLRIKAGLESENR